MSLQVDALTTSDMESLMERLCANYGGKKDFDARCTLYHEILSPFAVDVVRAAVDRVIRAGGEYFPKVHKLLEACRAIEKEQAGVDTSPRARMREWEADPYANVKGSSTDSDPCPICGELLVFSPRGIVIVHIDEKHLEAKVSYSNVGRPEWFSMGPPVMPLPKKQSPKPAPPPAPISVGAVAGAVLVNTLPKGALPPGTIPPVEEESEGGV